MGERVFRLSINLLLGIWMARQLGPSDFGLLSYAISYGGIFTVVAALGLNRILVRELVSAGERHDQTKGLLCTAFALRIVASLVLYFAAVSIACWQDEESVGLIALVAAGILFSPADSADLYFQAQLQSRYAAQARIFAFACGSAIKVWLLVEAAPLMAFAWLSLAECALGALFLWMVLTRLGPPLRWADVRLIHAKHLLGESAPEVLAALSGILLMRLDQVMLQYLAGPAEVGTFAVAARLSEIWYFVPVALVASAFPSIVTAREKDRAQFFHRLEMLTGALTVLAYGVAGLVVTLGVHLIPLLFGEAYREAGSVLVLQVWCGVFLVFAQTSGAWLMAEHRVRLNLYRSLIGVIVNVCANLALIPLYGARGAAVGTLMSFIAAYFLFDFFVTAMRPMANIKLRSLAIWPVFNPWLRARLNQSVKN